MNWLDIVLIVVIAGMGITQAFRGFGRGVFDALGLYGALWLAHLTAEPVAESVHFPGAPPLNLGVSYGVMLAIFGILTLLISRFVYGMTQMNAGMFEGFLGLLTGLAAGVILAHGLVCAMDLSDPTGNGSDQVIASGPVATEMLTFPTYHQVMETLTGGAAYRRQLPDVSK